MQQLVRINAHGIPDGIDPHRTSHANATLKMIEVAGTSGGGVDGLLRLAVGDNFEAHATFNHAIAGIATLPNPAHVRSNAIIRQNMMLMRRAV